MPISKTINFITDYLKTDIDIDNIIASAEYPECSCYAPILKKYCRAELQNDTAKAKVAEFLSAICEFDFTEVNNRMVLFSYLGFSKDNFKTSDIIDELDIEIINSLLSATKDYDLLARLYDLLFSAKNDYTLVPLVLEYYKKSIEKLVNYPCWIYPIERFKRIISLGKQTNNHQNESPCIEFLINQAKSNKQQLGSFFAINIAKYLSDTGLIKPYYDTLIEICESQAQDNLVPDKLYKSGDYYNELSVICHNANDYGSEKKFIKLYAETQVAIAEKSIQEEKSYMKASHFYSIAVENFKKAGDMQKYNETYKKLLDYQERALSEFHKFEQKIDLSEPINTFKEIFSGLNFFDSIIKLALFFKSPSKDTIDQYVKNQGKYLFKSIFPRTHVDNQGKVVAKGYTSEKTDEYKKQMAYEYLGYHWNITSYTLIQVFLEHITHTVFGKTDILQLVSSNPFVEPARINFFVDGLYEGFLQNFSISIHVLLPQIENMFRLVVKSNGLIPTKLVEGIQEELDINELLTKEVFKDVLENVFGSETILDIEALLIGKVGANLRNKLAHGLLTYDECYSIPAIYFFCMVLKIIVLGWLNNKQPEKEMGNLSDELVNEQG